MTFQKILIANRGEIACRVIRTARALGYRTVAVYSDADRNAPHVRQADEAVHIGAAPASASYLRMDAVLEAARRSGANAIHPGYGFLSERADFAQACADAGLVFIGPSAAAIAAMGDKALAKRRMQAAGVPCAPGYLGEDQSDEALTHHAQAVGLPLLVKAVAGGGGRGMRLVRQWSELAQALAGARREAQNAFGDATLMLERLIEGARHIEIQVFADQHGHAIHLGERDCSTQRRRQKVIEEAPSPAVSPELRARMGADAVAAALAVGYCGAGTVEFIVDADQRHYFLEMNTRLQVEHPVTECVTGLDLVEWQLRVAAGEPLPLRQDQVTLSGHAIEVRLYAEDPYDGFAPQSGTVQHWRPALALHGRDGHAVAFGGCRIDAGIVEGAPITPDYDPMVAKLIAHGRDRDDAIRRLRALLDDAVLLGVRHNGGFLRDLLGHHAFVQAQLHTTSLDDWVAQGHPLLQRPTPHDTLWALAAAALAAHTAPALRPASLARWSLTLIDPLGAGRQTLQVQTQGSRTTITPPGAVFEALHLQDDVLRFRLDGVDRSAICHMAAGTVSLALGATVYTWTEASPYPQNDPALDPRLVRASVAGTVRAITVRVGEHVRAGQPLLCIEAMKMEMWLNARADGTVRTIHTQVSDSVATGSVLVDIDTDHTPEESPS